MRIISLSPSNTDLILELGLGEQLVAVDADSDLPPHLAALPRVGTDLDADIPAIEALAPDLVVLSLSSEGEMKNFQEIRDLGLRHLAFETERFTDFLSDAYELAATCGIPRRGEEFVAKHLKRIEDVLAMARMASTPPRVYFEWWPTPRYSPASLSWITDMIHMAGGYNVFSEREGGIVRVSDEEIIAADPQVILLCHRVPLAQAPQPSRAVIECVSRPGYKALEAVKYANVSTLTPRLFAWPGPRLVDGLELLIELFGRISE